MSAVLGYIKSISGFGPEVTKGHDPDDASTFSQNPNVHEVDRIQLADLPIVVQPNEEQIEERWADECSESDEEAEPQSAVFEGRGQITNMVPGMPDGLIDGVYLFNQAKFAATSFFLHDRVWIKAVKYGLDWRVVDMRLDKDPNVLEIEARQKFTLTFRKVKSATPQQIVLEPLELGQGVATEVLKNTITEVELIPGDWLEVRTVESKGGANCQYSLGSATATLCDRQEVKGQVSEVRSDGALSYGVIDRCYFVPPSVWRSLDLKVNTPVRAVIFKSEQKDFWFRAGVVKEDASVLQSAERKRVEELCADKRGMKISPSQSINFGQLKIGSKKDALFTISNTSLYTHVLRSVTIQEQQTAAQFQISVAQESPEIVAVFVPAEFKNLEIKITCEPLLMGQTTDFCIFDFGDFQIYRELRVKVLPPEIDLLQNLTACRVSSKTHRKLHSEVQSEVERKHQPFAVPGRELVSAGVKQIRTAFFKAQVEKGRPFPIPDTIREAVKKKDARILFTHFPTLTATLEELKYSNVRKLTPENYKEMFHVALWMEELFHLTRRQGDNLENVIFSKSGDSFFFEFPKLQDVYPKFHVNDPIRFVDAADATGKIYHANIARLGASHIFIDLKEDVFQNYNGRPLCVEFLLGRTAYKRCHHAVDKVLENLGTEWLFPTAVTCLEPRIMFIEDAADGNHKHEVEEEALALLYRKKAPQKAAKKLKFGGGIPRGGKRAPNIYTPRPVDSKSVDSEPVDMKPIVGDPESPAAVDMQLKWANKSLNEEQKAAIRMILRGQARPCPYIIFGPPGTGKTVTVVEAVIQIYRLDPNSRILVCGPSNASANQLSAYLLDVGKFEPGEFVRFLGYNSGEGGMGEVLQNYCMDGNQIQSVYMCRIVITTCNSAAQFYEAYGIAPDRFTHVFIDEAGYCHEPDSLIPIILTSNNIDLPQIILAGDPNQLGPVLFDDNSSFYGLKTSLLERMMENPLYKRGEDFKYPPLLIMKLIRNYRAHRDLLALPSKLFYDNELIPASDEPLGELADRLDFLPKKGVPLLFHGVRGEQSRDSDSPSWYNPVEVVQIVNYVTLLLKNNCIPDDIGIISPYRKQVEKIKDALAREVKCRPIRVGSVEEFQGGEKKVILLSCVRSQDVDEESETLMRLSFAFHPKRFNVCLTRAKCLLIAIGNPHVFCQEYVWREFLKYAILKGVYIGCDLPLILQNYALKLGAEESESEDSEECCAPSSKYYEVGNDECSEEEDEF